MKQYPNVMLLIFLYLHTQIKNKVNELNELNKKQFEMTDIKSFQFNVESRGRLNEMMKFPIRKTVCGYKLFDKNDYKLEKLTKEEIKSIIK